MSYSPTKYDVVYNFIKTYLGFDGVLDFNSIQELVGTTALNAVGEDNVIRYYTAEKKLRRLTFSVIQAKDFDERGGVANLEAIAQSEAFKSWIEKQNKTGNLPDFGADCTAQRIKVEAPPYIGSVSSDNVAKYVVRISVDYMEE